MTKRTLLPATISSILLISTMGLTLSALVSCTAGNSQNQQADAEQPQTLMEDSNVDEEVIITASRVRSKLKRSPAKLAAAYGDAALKVSNFQLGHIPRDSWRSSDENSRENYRHRDENSFRTVTEHPVSTFSIDVDSASYANTRRFLNSGSLPQADAVRTEEFINYFNYSYPSPDNRDTPFSITTEIAPSPWAGGRHLLHVGLRGYRVETTELPPANLVFLVDVSGSMNSPNKLGLLKTSLKLLSKSLKKTDTVSIVVYAGASGVALEPVAGNQTMKIEAALERLQAGGSTNGAAGIQLAYSLARQNYNKDGINRVILATDGDFNVGVTGIEALKTLVKQQRDSGIALTTLGFGTGNYNDELMNEIAEIGNGNASYIDTALEARKALVEELSSTLFTIAKDVKIQIEFSPQVAEYRLIGYESRLLNREDFNNDKVDAGEIGAGHTVTALYEIVLKDSTARTTDPLRYNHRQTGQTPVETDELAYLKLRYKLPEQTASTLVQQAIKRQQIKKLADTSNNFRWSATAAAFAQQLAGSNWIQGFDYQNVIALGKSALGNDPHGYRAEMLKLVRMADTLKLAQSHQPVDDKLRAGR